MDGQLVNEHLNSSTSAVASITSQSNASGGEVSLAGEFRQMKEVQKRARIGCWFISADRSAVTWTDEVYALIGRTRETYPPSFHRMIECLHPDDRHLLDGLRPGDVTLIDGNRFEARLNGPDGQTRYVAIEAWTSLADDALGGLAGFIQDISGRKEAELALVRSEKLAILGNLTGAVAHDFNNLLTVVSLNLEEAIAELPLGHDLQDILVPALHAAQRGADLTSQLLSYARQAPLRPQAITMETFFLACRPLLQRAAGVKHSMLFSVNDGCSELLVDRMQLQTALLNLVTNARDASPENSTIAVDVDSVTLPDGRFNLHDPVPGRYTLLSVADKGSGMTEDVLQNALTPFFSTKTVGGSCGLGLSMVDGFVKQSRGHILISSEIGSGSIVSMFLPLADVEVGSIQLDSGLPRRPTVLIVDDEPAVLATVSRMFSQLGYAVRAVAEASSALAEIEANPNLDILFSDVVLGGGVSGIDLCEIVRRRIPGIKVLLTSGFNNQSATASGIDDVVILQKPYKRQELYDRLSCLLQAPRPLELVSEALKSD